MHNVQQVLQVGMCAGCGLCAADDKGMKMDAGGFLRPLDPVCDEISNSACPGHQVAHFNYEAPYDLLWGPLLSCETGYALDDYIRNQGSSGGLLTALLVYLLDEKCVDAVIQVGVSTENPIRNSTYIQKCRDDVIANAGSRYAPSAPLEVIRELLGDGKTYAFVGKPCDVAAMRALLQSFPQYRSQFPYLLTFMCAGVPSEVGTQAVLEKFGIQQKDLISFRYRGDGWPGMTKAVTTSNKVYTMTYNESWGSILNRHLQARCKLCADGIGEAADIVCGDAWHASENGYPSFEEQNGRSLTLARTERGRSLLDAAQKAGVINLSPYPIESINQIQPYQVNRKQTTQARKLAVGLLGGKTPKYVDYHLKRLAVSAGFKANIKAFVGTAVRKIKRRI